MADPRKPLSPNAHKKRFSGLLLGRRPKAKRDSESRPPVTPYRLFGAEAGSPAEFPNAHKALPAGLDHCLQYINTHDLSAEGVMRTTERSNTSKTALDKLEKDAMAGLAPPFPDIWVACAVYKRILGNLDPPVIPLELQLLFFKSADIISKHAGNATLREPFLRELLHRLPPIHLQMIRDLTHVCAAVDARSATNLMPLSNLARMVGPLLLFEHPFGTPTVDKLAQHAVRISQVANDVAFELLTNGTLYAPPTPDTQLLPAVAVESVKGDDGPTLGFSKNDVLALFPRVGDIEPPADKTRFAYNQTTQTFGWLSEKCCKELPLPRALVRSASSPGPGAQRPPPAAENPQRPPAASEGPVTAGLGALQRPTHVLGRHPSPVVGIDLGTSTILMAYLPPGSTDAKVLENGRNLLTPSVLALHCDKLDAEKVFFGEGAKKYVRSKYPEHVMLYDAKRFIGRQAADPDVKTLLETDQYPFRIVADPNGSGNAMMRIKSVSQEGREKGLYRDIAPSTVSAALLKHVKEECFLKKYDLPFTELLRAVVTVPANFDESQRRATLEAAEKAGIVVERLLSEPTAAAMAYLYGKKAKGNYVVFDFGGGTLDVSLVDVDGDKFVVKATAGDPTLGGRNIDDLLFLKFRKDLHDEDIPLMYDPDMDKKTVETFRKYRAYLKDNLSELKHQLSEPGRTEAEIELSFGSETRVISMTRAEFEDLIRPLLERLTKPLDEVLSLAGLRPDDIKRSGGSVLLAGGSSRIPAVEAALRRYFPSGTPILSGPLNQEHVVAIGAAYAADIVQRKEHILDIQDIYPRQIGIETFPDKVDVLVRACQSLPVREKRTYYAHADRHPFDARGRTTIPITIVEGSSEKASENKIVERIEFRDVPADLDDPDVAQVDVELSLDHNGVLLVTVSSGQDGKSQTVRVVLQGRQALSNDELQHLASLSLSSSESSHSSSSTYNHELYASPSEEDAFFDEPAVSQSSESVFETEEVAVAPLVRFTQRVYMARDRIENIQNKLHRKTLATKIDAFVRWVERTEAEEKSEGLSDDIRKWEAKFEKEMEAVLSENWHP